MEKMSNQILSCEIRNFVEFLETSLRKKVLEYTLKELTKPGDNFGGVLRSVEVKVAENDSNEVTTILIATKIAKKNSYFIDYYLNELVR